MFLPQARLHLSPRSLESLTCTYIQLSFSLYLTYTQIDHTLMPFAQRFTAVAAGGGGALSSTSASVDIDVVGAIKNIKL